MKEVCYFAKSVNVIVDFRVGRVGEVLWQIWQEIWLKVKTNSLKCMFVCMYGKSYTTEETLDMLERNGMWN